MNAPVSAAASVCRFASKEGKDGPLCHCTGVSEAAVRGAIDFRGVSSVEEVVATTGAGSGCRACHCRIQRVLNGLPAQCGGRFDWCHECSCIRAVCRCEAA
ncbi:MAG: (2Fe-2S)-binding protein [Verrucomicrobiae bacterium]|nr:(2Fe-2S)-binding protein [Verrucomicrobiae bacterium]